MRLQTLWQTPKGQPSQHAAFTDLSHFDQAWYCVFRVGSTHMSLDGHIVVLHSTDSIEWQEHSRLSWQGGDLRDPKLSVSPNNQLILTAGIRWAVPSAHKNSLSSVGWTLLSAGVSAKRSTESGSDDCNKQNRVNAESGEGERNSAQSDQAWSDPVINLQQSTWRWATTWHQGHAYSVGYGANDLQGCLYRSADGLHWEAWVKPFFPDARIYSNESSLVSDGQTMRCLTRRDAVGGAQAILGCAIDTLKVWQWKTLPLAIGGPKLLRLSNDEWVMAVRRIHTKRGTAKTQVYKLNPHTAQVKLWRSLPSEGDCSYPGLVEKEGALYVSYYSSHLKDETAIFLAVIPLIAKKRSRRFE